MICFSFFQLLLDLEFVLPIIYLPVLVSFSCYPFREGIENLGGFPFQFLSVVTTKLTISLNQLPLVLVSFSCYQNGARPSPAVINSFSFFQLLQIGKYVYFENTQVLVSFSCYSTFLTSTFSFSCFSFFQLLPSTSSWQSSSEKFQFLSVVTRGYLNFWTLNSQFQFLSVVTRTENC